MPDGEARAMFQAWKDEAGVQAQDTARFARWLVARKLLTEYQVNLLAQGYGEGFFLGQYKILDRLGTGRMAGVYHGVHEFGQEVAIKVLPPSKARDPQSMARFQREARLALQLNHPNVVRAFHVGEAGGLHYFVMEYLEGEALDEILQRRGRLPPAEAANIVYQALLGLQYIHQQGLVHRDLKPSNLMLFRPYSSAPGATATVKILDIGLGRSLFDEGNSVKPAEGRLTTNGVILGTPDYMSPEQAQDPRAVDIRSDIYSLGCVLYHLIAGQQVFPDTNIISQMIRHATEDPRPLKEFNPEVPDGLQQIVNWMIAKDPARRYPTPERAAQALQVYLAAGAEVVARADPSPQLRQYLTWLELGGKEGPGLRAVGSVPMASEVPVPAPVVSKTPSSKKNGKRKGGKHRHRPAGVQQAAVPVRPQPTGPPSLDVAPNVELVPLAGNRQQVPTTWLRISWRDFIMFGLGAVGSLIAITVAWLLTRLLL
jgi:serine/threonine protein kinase